MPGTDGRWVTTRFADPADLRHDMHVNIVTFEPGAVIPFAETHVMEHGLYVLEGKAVYRLNQDWVEVQEGDFMWLRAFCPQACYAGGPGRFRYLLYKDVNRHAGAVAASSSESVSGRGCCRGHEGVQSRGSTWTAVRRRPRWSDPSTGGSPGATEVLPDGQELVGPVLTVPDRPRLARQ